MDKTIQEVHASNLHTYVRKEVLKLFDSLPPSDSRTLREITHKLDYYSEVLVQSVVNVLVEERELNKLQLTAGTCLYSRRPAFEAKHFTPLFAGTPEWKIVHRDGTQIALCAKEIHARLIVEALNRR